MARRCSGSWPMRWIARLVMRGARLVLAVATLLLASCGGGGGDAAFGPAPPGVLAIAANPQPVPPPQPQDYVDAVDLARHAGMRGAVVTWRWSDLEPAPGTYDLTDVTDNMDFWGTARPSTIFVGVQVLNTVKREVPADLAAAPFDSVQMRDRFRALLDRLLPLLDDKVLYLSIGNEVDVYLRTYPGEVAAYRQFYADAVAYVHQKAPNLRVGVTATFDGAAGAGAAIMADLNQASDVIMLTYYPLAANFAVRDPASPAVDFPLMLGLDPDKDVVLQEVGYPASPLLGSSDAAQAEFVDQVFTAWEGAGGRIPLLSFFLLHDLTQDVCDTLGDYYGLPNSTAFKAYLCTLGLRRTDGTPRPAWDTLVTRAAAAGLP